MSLLENLVKVNVKQVELASGITLEVRKLSADEIIGSGLMPILAVADDKAKMVKVLSEDPAKVEAFIKDTYKIISRAVVNIRLCEKELWECDTVKNEVPLKLIAPYREKLFTAIMEHSFSSEEGNSPEPFLEEQAGLITNGANG